MSQEQVTVPKEIRNATIVIYVEALGLLVAAGVLISKIFTGHPNSLGRAWLDVAFPLAGAAVLCLGARGIGRLRSGARSPIVIVQVLALPVAFDMAFQAGLYAYGIPILVLALTVLYLLFRPASNEALERSVN